MSDAIYKVKEADKDTTIYEKKVTVEQIRTFTIAQLEAEIVQQQAVITSAQARIVSIEADKAEAIAAK